MVTFRGVTASTASPFALTRLCTTSGGTYLEKANRALCRTLKAFCACTTSPIFSMPVANCKSFILSGSFSIKLRLQRPSSPCTSWRRGFDIAHDVSAISSVEMTAKMRDRPTMIAASTPVVSPSCSAAAHADGAMLRATPQKMPMARGRQANANKKVFTASTSQRLSARLRMQHRLHTPLIRCCCLFIFSFISELDFFPILPCSSIA
mmetsp:Transcript_18722/g.47367  ORF Transcript_18722/g.47367 Transcript_18722/m.47367 type:complete len:207 (-) Transcript_18722:783-1403(-)